MDRASYTAFLDFFKKHPSGYDRYSDEDFNSLERLIDGKNLNLTEILTAAVEVSDLDQISVIIESIRRNGFLEKGGPDLYKLLLTTGIEFVTGQANSIQSDLMWNVKQILDIDLHQSHLVSHSSRNTELYFQLCYELLDPRFRALRGTDELEIYDSCIYFVMFSTGTFENNKSHLQALQPRIQWIIDHDYGQDHHLSEEWIALFKKLNPTSFE